MTLGLAVCRYAMASAAGRATIGQSFQIVSYLGLQSLKVACSTAMQEPAAQGVGLEIVKKAACPHYMCKGVF